MAKHNHYAALFPGQYYRIAAGLSFILQQKTEGTVKADIYAITENCRPQVSLIKSWQKRTGWED